MRNVSRFLPLPLLLLLLLALALSCKPSSPDGKGSSDPTSMPAPTPKRTPLMKPELLFGKYETMRFVTLIPPEDSREKAVNLRGEPRYIAYVRVAVECADQATLDELNEMLAHPNEQVSSLISRALETQSLALASTRRGKMEFKEELIRRLQENLVENKGVKQVYIQDFILVRERVAGDEDPDK